MTKKSVSTAQLSRKAQKLIQQSKYQAALKTLAPLFKQEPVPKEAFKWSGLALILMQDFVQACSLLETASKDYPDDPDVFTALGRCYFELEQLTQAEQAFKQSLQLRPQHAITQFELVKVYVSQHRYTDELRLLEELIERLPDEVDVWRQYSKYYRFNDPQDPKVLKIKALEGRGNQLNNEYQTRLYSTLGKVYEDLGQPEQAFHYYQQSNLCQKALRDQAAETSLIKLLHIYRSFYSPEQTARLRRLSGLEAFPELMIVGMPRSGKSLVESLIACHPQVQAGGESYNFIQYANRLASYQSNMLDYFSKDSAALRHDAQGYLDSRNWPEHGLVTSTLPSNLEALSFLGVWFPKAPIIFVTRALEDLGLAIYFKDFKEGHTYSTDIYQTGRQIAATEALIEHWTQVLPNPCVKVHYEDLVNRPAQVSKALYQFLDLDWKPEYFAGLKEQRHLSANIAPHQSLDTPAPLRNDYIGWSKPYQKFLEPLHRGYQEVLAGDTPTSSTSTHSNTQLAISTTAQAQARFKQLLDQHSVHHAFSIANQLVQHNPKNLGFLRSLGIAASLAGQDEEALNILKHALKDEPKNKGLLVNLVRACIRASEFSQAQKYLDKLETLQADTLLREQLALEMFVASGSHNQNKLKAFSTRAQALLTQPPDDLEVRRLAAVIQARLGEVDAALEHMQQLCDLLEQQQLAQPQVALSPQRTQILIDQAEASSQKQPGSAEVVDYLWRACQQYPYSRATQKAWKQLGKALQAASDAELQNLNQLHQRIIQIWSTYKSQQLEFSFGDFDLPYQGLESLKLAGTRPAEYRLERYGLRSLLPANARALDIGCNHGYLLMGLADQLSLGRGFDISEVCIEVGQAVAEHLQLSQIQLSSETFDEFIAEPQEQYDLIIACAVHHWIGKPLPVFGQHLFDLCSPGGLLLLESQGIRELKSTEPNFEAKALEMTQDRFDLLHRGDICDDAINYRKFWLLRRKPSSGE